MFHVVCRYSISKKNGFFSSLPPEEDYPHAQRDLMFRFGRRTIEQVQADLSASQIFEELGLS